MTGPAYKKRLWLLLDLSPILFVTLVQEDHKTIMDGADHFLSIVLLSRNLPLGDANYLSSFPLDSSFVPQHPEFLWLHANTSGCVVVVVV